MEIDGEDGTTIELRASDEAVLGRGSGFVTTDCTVSRRHILFRADNALTEPVRASFEVLGRNPVWVRRGGASEVRVYRTSEKGELAAGDWLCVSGRQPAWYAVKGIDAGRDLGSESEVEAENFCILANDVDPVKEFGFLVIGHEFDQYPKQRLRRVADWNWFLEEPTKDGSEDDDEYEEGKKKPKPRSRKKRKKLGGHNEDEDEDWSGESEEEKEDLARPLKAQKQAYLTRSKDRRMPSKRSGGGDNKLTQKRASASRDDDDAEEDEEDEEDETLGGFIVTDDDVEQEEVEGDEDEEEEEEEEEFIEDDDEEE